MTRMDQSAGTVDFENLIYSNNVALDTFTVTVKTGQGTLERGTLLAVDAEEKMNIAGTASTTVNCVLADDVDTSSGDVKATAYRTGHFNSGKLILAEGTTLTDAMKEALRDVGILLSEAV